MKIEVPTDGVPGGHSDRYPAKDSGQGGQTEGGNTITATEGGGGKGGGSKSRGITLARGGSCREKAQDRKK